MEIRRAALSDVQTISALGVDVHELHVAAQPDYFKPVTGEDWAVPAVMARMADPASYYFIVSVDGEDVGYVLAQLRDRPENVHCYRLRSLYIEEISVRPAFRRRGCGAMLVAAVRDLGRALQVDRIVLDHWEFNQAAHGFFADQGFVTYSERMWLKP